MKGIWIAAVIAAAIEFVFYCCLLVAAEEDERMEKYRRDETGNFGKK